MTLIAVSTATASFPCSNSKSEAEEEARYSLVHQENVFMKCYPARNIEAEN